MNKMKVKVLEGGFLPTKAYEGDMGYDLYSPSNYFLYDSSLIEIDCKIQIELPDGYGFYIRPRGGLGRKGVNVYAGVVDGLYRGNVLVLLRKSRSVGDTPNYINRMF